ncbi:DNA-binding protein [Streptomyces sp. NPDC005562]|uniref:DNA-binding protein n=1 Tax=Streptomyces sp. NPDC005562 TaxID=3154890 RepID=UPI0033A1ACA2
MTSMDGPCRAHDPSYEHVGHRTPLPAANPGRPASSVPDVVRTMRRLLDLDAGRGARAAVPVLPEAARTVPELAAEPARLATLDSELLAALAELCEVIGWILFDAGLHRQAHRANARALALAELCGDRWTGRLVLLNHSMLQAHTGHPRAALATASRVPGPRPLPARVGALVLIRQAHATAMLGADRAATRRIARARDLFLDGVSAGDPHWAWWIDETELLGHEGWVSARLHRWDQAIPLLRRAAAVPDGPSYRELFSAELLSALVGAGAWRDAEELIREVAPRVARIGSARAARSLGATAARLLRPGAGVPTASRDAAVHLSEALSAPERPPADRP